MLTYETLVRKPGAFTSMTGLTSAECEALLAEVREPYDSRFAHFWR